MSGDGYGYCTETETGPRRLRLRLFFERVETCLTRLSIHEAAEAAVRPAFSSLYCDPLKAPPLADNPYASLCLVTLLIRNTELQLLGLDGCPGLLQCLFKGS